MKNLSKKRRIAMLIVGVAIVLIGIFGIKYYLVWYPIAPVPKDGVIKVACIGDSITYGTGTKDLKTDSYPAQLQTLLGSDYQVLNYGLFGRSLQMDAEKPYIKEKFYKASQEAQPHIVLIMLGTNDTAPQNWSAPNYEKDLEAFVSTYQNLDSRPDVYLMKCPPSYDTQFSDGNVLANEVIPIIDRVAEKMGIQTIDIFSALTNHPELFPDGLHPNADGAKIIAEKVYDTILEN